jgi:hypothetical protein
MAKVAKLVYISLVTRVIVEENATEDDIIMAAKPKFMDSIFNDFGENLEKIVDDTECPYEEEPVCYHPQSKRVRTHRGYHCDDCGKRF